MQLDGLLRLVLTPLILGWLLGSGTLSLAADPQTTFFENKIRPILAAHCYECHSAAAAAKGKLKAGLALDTRESTLRGGESGPAVVPGDPSKSLLLAALKYDGFEMPPSEKLSDAIIADFEKWIALGAPDPRAGAAVVVKRGMTAEEGRKFWSFIPPQRPNPPLVKRAAWPRDDLDRFVLTRQEAEGLQPLGDADPRTLMRRLCFDLTGLPPAPAEVDEFVHQSAATKASTNSKEADVAYEALVDRLLASRHFGERWGRHWLDAARYADSNGRDRNMYFYHAWRYRDYVIDSFNRDKPYDRFIREQIAGDLLPFDTLEQRDEQRIATGFLALGAKAFEETKPEVFRMDVIDEQIEVVSRSVLGLSIGCARCHDHKFDPIPTADYYALAGVFRSTETLYGYGPIGTGANAHSNSSWQAIGLNAEKLGPEGLAHWAKLNNMTLARNKARSDRYRVVRLVAAAKLELAKPDADKEKIEQNIAKQEIEIKEWDARIKGLDEELKATIDAAPPQPGWALAVRERAKPEDCRIHIRGETTNLGATVPRGRMQLPTLSNSTAEPPAVEPGSVERSGRLELANWLTAHDQPLTARVWVNRVWLHLFGRGLVTTPDDYGVNGARPTHPELLDHLAVRFMEDQQWSIKRLVRAIVLSRTYRLASSAEGSAALEAGLGQDPDNVYLWRMAPRRMDVEVFRDAIMAVAGTLDPAPIRPEQAFLAQYNPYREDEYRPFQPLFLQANLEHAFRSVYLPVVRGVLPEMFQLFDFAESERPIAQREASTVPAQSLFLMNSPWVIQQARATARKLLVDESFDDTNSPGDARRVERLYRTAFARLPTADEITRALTYLAEPETLLPDPKNKTSATAAQLREERWTSYCQVIFSSAEFRTIR
jgi:hypothetical protein